MPAEEEMSIEQFHHQEMEEDLLECLVTGDSSGAALVLKEMDGLSKHLTNLLGIMLSKKKFVGNVDKKLYPYRLEFKTWNGKGNPGKNEAEKLKEHTIVKSIRRLMASDGLSKTAALKAVAAKKKISESHLWYLCGKHSQYFDHSFNFIERPQVLFDRGENGQSNLLCGKFALFFTHTGTNTANDKCAIFL